MERRYDNLIQHAKAYIEDNYNHEDISLNMVASEVNLSSSHFSTVFGQETGSHDPRTSRSDYQNVVYHKNTSLVIMTIVYLKFLPITQFNIV